MVEQSCLPVTGPLPEECEPHRLVLVHASLRLGPVRLAKRFLIRFCCAIRPRLKVHLIEIICNQSLGYFTYYHNFRIPELFVDRVPLRPVFIRHGQIKGCVRLTFCVREESQPLCSQIGDTALCRRERNKESDFSNGEGWDSGILYLDLPENLTLETHP